jgi:hypothetical protein
MKSWIIAFCVLLLVILTGCRHNEVQVVFSDVGDPLLYAKAGDVIKWSNNGKPVAVNFKYGANPCSAGDAVGTCKIQATQGEYFYDCQGCADPAIVVGSDVSRVMPTAVTGILPPPYATPKDPKVYCDAGQTKVSQPITAKAGDSFEIYPVGDIAFSVNFATGTCNQGDSLKNNASSCTIKIGATSQPTYPIHIDKCKDGTGSLTVSP